MAVLAYQGMGGSNVVSKASSDASKPLEPATPATSAVGGDQAPTAGKAIPIFSGSVKLEGEVIWARLFRNEFNECRGHIAVCFGQNVFGRPMTLSTIDLNGVAVYNRAGGSDIIDPPDAVRFYDGTQIAADPLIVEFEGLEFAWPGYTYAVLENIILADKYTAEVTDNGSSDATEISFGCDPDLDAIELILDPHTGLSYGIEFPMSGTSNLITSDGCQIIRRVPIPNYNRLTPANADEEKFFTDSIFPIPCTGLVVIAGFDGLAYLNDPNQIHGATLVRPSTGEPINTGDDNAFREFLQLGKASIFHSSMPASTGIEYKLAYKLPGGNYYFVLRFFERGDTVIEDSHPGYIVPGSGNVCGTIYDISIEGLKDGPDYLWDGSDELNLADPNGGVSLYEGATGWWTDGCPFVDEIIYGRTRTSSVELAAYKQVFADIEVYRIEHSDGGMEATVTTTITAEVATGIGFDTNTNNILITTDGDKIYHVTPLGFTSYSIPTGLHLSSRNTTAPFGKAVLRNATGTEAYLYDPETQTTTQIYDDPDVTGEPIIDAARSLVHLPTASGIVTKAIDTTATEDITLIGLLTDICNLRGYDTADLSFIGLADQSCRGLKLTASVSAADLINRIGLLYSFIFAETDGKLKFIRRRAADGSYTPDVSLTDADLVEGASKITAQRNAATKVLTSLELSWIDPTRDFETNSFVAYRTNGIFTGDASVRDDRLSLPLVIEPNQARQLLFESFYAQVEAETLFSVSLPPEHVRIEPGTLLALDAGGAERLALVRRVTHRADNNTLDIEAEAFMAQASTSISGDTDANPPTGPEAGVAGVYVHLDIPLIRTTDFQGAAYAIQYHGLTTPEVSDWDGADLYRSRDGTNFTKLFEYDYAPMTVARAENVLVQPALLFAMDTESELIITVQSGDADLFRTVTYLEQMNGANLCAYGRPDKWEIISFQTVTDNLDGTLSLTNLQRGLFGTDMVFDANIHTLNDRVCILENLKTLSSVYGVVDIGINERWGVVTPSHPLEASGPSWHVMSGVSVRPLAVANVIAEHTAGAATLEISWDARSTIPGIWRDDGTPLAMPETYTYGVNIDTSAGEFDFVVSATSYSWADYGAELGADALAHEEVFGVTVWPISPVWGASYETTAIGREA